MHRTERPIRRTVPLNLILDGRPPALVVGGGQVGRRKTAALLDAGASVDLVCPAAVPELAALADVGRLRWRRRPWRAGDAAGHALVFACTDDKHVNRAVLDDARRAGVLCCCADLNWPDGDFTTPAVARAAGLTVAVSTGGQDCRAARDARNDILAVLSAAAAADLVVIGTSDAVLLARRRAPLHRPPAARAALGAMLARVRGLREFFILNTCNRIELVARAAPDDALLALLLRLMAFDALADGERYVLRGDAAFRHMALTAAGLESPLLGENHIVAQIKDAVAEADACGWLGSALRGVCAETMRAAKAVRHATEGLLHVAEIDQVAVRYLKTHGGLDAASRVLVIGTGAVGTGVVTALQVSGAAVTWLYHRRDPLGASCAPSVEVRRARVCSRPLADLPAALAAADIVVTAVDAAEPVVTAALGAAVDGRDVLFVDLGMPRNVDRSYDDRGRGVTVVDLDDLKRWQRVKSGVLEEVMARADAALRPFARNAAR